jgi:hypothetical protein
VILDVCVEHGSWLDADELEQITGFILSGGVPSPIFAESTPKARAEARATAEFALVRAQFEVQRAHSAPPPRAGDLEADKTAPGLRSARRNATWDFWTSCVQS